VVPTFDALARIPLEYRGKISFFSVNDMWDFDAVLDTRVCESCEELEGSSWTGDFLRQPFPNLVILDENTIGGPDDGDGLVHPNCRCRLRRQTQIIQYYIELQPTDEYDTVFDYYARKHKRKARFVEKGEVENTKILIINKPNESQQQSFINTLEKAPKEHLKDLETVQLINAPPPKRTRKTRTKKIITVTRGNICTWKKSGKEIITVYSRQPSEVIPEILNHEIGHHVERFLLTKEQHEDWRRIWWTNQVEMPSDLGRKDFREGFAECYAQWRKGWQYVNPTIRKWFGKNVK